MKFKSPILLACLLGFVLLRNANADTAKETQYLAFQIFTYGPNPLIATMGEGPNPQPARFPEKAVLRDYIGDIKQRIGTVGSPQTRLAVMLGHLSFDHSDADVTKFIEMGFDLAIETDVAVGFHIDDAMFWAGRKDLVSDPNNVEAMDWDGTPSTGRRLDWSKTPSVAPPQMCYNSKVIQREVQQRSALIGKAIQAGVNRLQQLKNPELFAGVIAGSETMIGQDFKTGNYFGYRALMNRGFSREHPPQDMDLEREKVVQEWIELWSKGLADAGVSPQKIYSHTAFLSRRAFGGDDKDITYMKRQGEMTYSQHNHFAPPSVAFGKYHRPGFSTYPQAGLFEDIYEELAKHQQVGWASCEGTDMQPSSGPGQTGMSMETYLAKMFNHGAALTTIFSWGLGGDANKNMGFRVVTEGEEALQAYRKFLKGIPLVEGVTVAGLTDRLPPKIHKIQQGLPAWVEKTGNKEAVALMQKMQEQMKAKNFDEVEKTADAILEMMGASASSATPTPSQATPEPPRSAQNTAPTGPPPGVTPTSSNVPVPSPSATPNPTGGRAQSMLVLVTVRENNGRTKLATDSSSNGATTPYSHTNNKSLSISLVNTARQDLKLNVKITFLAQDQGGNHEIVAEKTVESGRTIAAGKSDVFTTDEVSFTHTSAHREAPKTGAGGGGPAPGLTPASGHIYAGYKVEVFRGSEIVGTASSDVAGLASGDLAKTAASNAETSKTEALPLQERLPAKIQKIQKELPAWIQTADNKEKAMPLMHKLQEQMNAKNLEEVDKTADAILEMMGVKP